MAVESPVVPELRLELPPPDVEAPIAVTVLLADLLNRCMSDMLDQTWRRGMYRDVDKVIA